ncbi:hypothetical protein GPALN_006684 [Globodera pallida]|nr:hypothetical protein GPALN_006684 [Globodera pallida]
MRERDAGAGCGSGMRERDAGAGCGSGMRERDAGAGCGSGIRERDAGAGIHSAKKRVNESGNPTFFPRESRSRRSLVETSCMLTKSTFSNRGRAASIMLSSSIQKRLHSEETV